MEPKPETRLLIFYYLLMPLFLEGLALFTVSQGLGLQGFGLAFALHVLGALILLVLPFCKADAKSPRDRYYLFFCGWLVLFFPGVGVVGCFLMLLFGTQVMKSQGTVDDFQSFEDHLHYNESILAFSGDVSDFLEDEISIEPMVDIVEGKDADLKRGVVKYLEQLGTPAAIALLKRCLRDENPEIKYYTHSALESLDSEWIKRIDQARMSLGANPSDPVLLKVLAMIYRDYAHSGLAAKETQFYFRVLAQETFEQSLAMHPDSVDLILVLGQSCLGVGHYDDAIAYFERAIVLGADVAEPLLGLCQANFERGDMVELAKVCCRLRAREAMEHADPYKNSLVQFWATPLEV